MIVPAEELERGLMQVSEYSSRSTDSNQVEANFRLLAGLRISPSKFEESLKWLFAF